MSLTSACCKVMERLVSAHMLEYLNRFELLSPKQFGFRKGHSTEDQLLLTYSKVIEQVDQGNTVDMVYLDYSKAFDVVCHSVLLGKLEQLGFNRQILVWLEGFLCGRTTCVSVGGRDSGSVEVLSGVPQGSVLGPLLFLIYVNSLGSLLRCEWFAFADDFKLYFSFPRNAHSANVNPLQRDLDDLFQASSSWNLKLNPEKCVVMRFGGGCRGSESGSGYFINGRELQLVKSHRDLGIAVDSSLKFHIHINGVVWKASGLAGQLLRGTVCRSRCFMVTLFVSHIRPILDYCSTLWNLGYLSDVRRLEGVQRRWTKEVVGLGDLDYLGRLRVLELYSIYGRMFRADLIKIWKAFHADVDVGLHTIFERQIHRSTRGHQFKLSVPRCRSEIRRRFLNVRCVKAWNDLPEHVVEVDSVNVFKGHLDRDYSDMFFQLVG